MSSWLHSRLQDPKSKSISWRSGEHLEKTLTLYTFLTAIQQSYRHVDHYEKEKPFGGPASHTDRYWKPCTKILPARLPDHLTMRSTWQKIVVIQPKLLQTEMWSRVFEILDPSSYLQFHRHLSWCGSGTVVMKMRRSDCSTSFWIRAVKSSPIYSTSSFSHAS